MSDQAAAEETAHETAEPDEAQLLEDPSFERLLQFLRDSRSFDFTGYKRPSLMRRVRHRMREIGIDSFEDYQDTLQLQPSEFTELFNTILINVTSFFRDPEAWEHLRTEILPQVLETSGSGQLRVWSAGCSAGQEPYTIAMLLHEEMGSGFRERVKIYATDVDEDALNCARQASYTERETRGLPASYRERYFDLVNGRYVFTPDLRRSVIFGRNDLTSDAPISRIDILLCRNTLMYPNAETQARVVSRLGFAPRPNGVLFLGKAEMLLNHETAFRPSVLKRRFFRRVSEDVTDAGFGAPARPIRETASDQAMQLRNEILQTNPIAQIAVGTDGHLAMVNNRAEAMLGLSDRDLGRPFQDLDVSYRPLELRSQLAAVTESRAPVWLREVEWRRAGPEAIYVDVNVVPLLDTSGEVLGVSISFTDVTRFRQLRVEVETASRQLELAYEELQSTNEELETTNEELQSTVEELETTNEELQSTNEELETMNEELQSTNEELQTMNDELRIRSDELNSVNAFLESILGSFQAAVVVVDAELRVQSWNDQASELWGLRIEEVLGQHLLNLDIGLPVAKLRDPIRASVATGTRDELVLEALNRRGRTIACTVTISPLRGAKGDLRGAIVLMEDREEAAQ